MSLSNNKGSQILRTSYTTKSGKYVPAKYITKTGILSGKSTVRTKQLIASAKKRSQYASSLTRKESRVRCPKGMILRTAYIRKGYTRNSGSKVKRSLTAANCIKDVGKKGKGQQIIVLDPNDHYLSEFGYENVVQMSSANRKKCLMRLIKHFIPIKGQMPTYNYVIRALVARHNLNRNTNPKVAKIFKKDQEMISAMYKKIKKDS